MSLCKKGAIFEDPCIRYGSVYILPIVWPIFGLSDEPIGSGQVGLMSLDYLGSTSVLA